MASEWTPASVATRSPNAPRDRERAPPHFRHDRRGLENRLWYLEKTLSAGLRWRIADGVFLDASAGWAFDRFWFEGKTYEDRDFNRIDLADGPLVGLWFSARF